MAEPKRSEPAPFAGKTCPVGLTADVLCAMCGYNLRGQVGDPVRCPECGQSNRVAIGEPPEEYVLLELRALSGNAVVGFWSTALALSAGITGLLLRILGRAEDELRILCDVGFITFAAVAAACVLAHYRNCQRAPGWGRLLLRTYGYMAAGVVLAGAAVWALVAILDGILGRGGRGWPIIVASFALLFVPGGLAIVYLLARFQGLLRKSLYVTAVAKARERWRSERAG